MALKWVLGDFETASSADLKKQGSARYAEDPTTEILCFGYTLSTGGTSMWKPGDDITELNALALDDSYTFIAHNAAFEKMIWRHIMVPVYGFADIPDHRWHDTMAVCAMKGLPQDLDRATLVLRLPAKKDKEGSSFTKGLSKPNKKTGALDRSPASLQRVYDYNYSDLDAEVSLHDRVGWLPPGERKVWLLDQRINGRGVRLDLDYIAACQDVVEKASVPLQEEFRAITGGLNVTQRDATLKWIASQGVNIPDMKKETLDEILGSDDTEGEVGEDTGTEYDPLPRSADLPEQVHRALAIRQLIGSASIKKLGAMQGCVLSDGRAYNLLQYHGAGPGRWAGRLLQPQNFPRGTLKGTTPEGTVEAIMTRDCGYIEMILGKPPVECVVSGLRHTIVSAPERLLVAGDFSTIELRVLLALAGQTDKIDLIRGGGDPYCDMATLIYGYPVTKAMAKERQDGKASVLGLGFQMGALKFQWKYMKKSSLEDVQRVVGIYREEWAPLVPKVWSGLQKAACDAVWKKTPQEAYGVTYALEDAWLTARLPSGRKLWYFNPQPVRQAMPWDETDIRPGWTYQAMKMGKWTTIKAYGGHLTENVVQALARDIMVDGMFRAEANGFPVILTVHDELITEPERANADHKALEQIMAEGPAWAREMGIPIKAEGWTGDRYRK